MYWVVVSIMTATAMAFIAWPIIRDRRSLSGRIPILLAVAVALPLLALGIHSANVGTNDKNNFAAELGLDSIAWANTVPAEVVLTDSATSVAPISTLIVGLEARLAGQPEDAKGWALLAQSYAFLANVPKSELAIAKAVEFGFDESDLRARVANALRSVGVVGQSDHDEIPPGVIHGVVRLSADFELGASPDQRLFVYAKATDGSAVPIAAIKRRVTEFPYQFVLDNRESMTPWASLSDVDEVVVSARLSSSGTADAHEGGGTSNSQVIQVASPEWVELVIGG